MVTPLVKYRGSRGFNSRGRGFSTFRPAARKNPKKSEKRRRKAPERPRAAPRPTRAPGTPRPRARLGGNLGLEPGLDPFVRVRFEHHPPTPPSAGLYSPIYCYIERTAKSFRITECRKMLITVQCAFPHLHGHISSLQESWTRLLHDRPRAVCAARHSPSLWAGSEHPGAKSSASGASDFRL